MEIAPQNRTADEWRQLARDADRKGEHLMAYDFAMAGLETHGDDPWLAYQAVLALARGGATDNAERAYRAFGLDKREDEDMASLGARILKDKFHAAPPKRRAAAAATSAAGYEAVFVRTGGSYPGINAASMWLFADEAERSRDIARRVLRLCDQEGGDGDYWLAATRAEAALLLGDAGQAAEWLAEAGALGGGDFAAIAATRRQLRLVCQAVGIDPAILDALAMPAVIHYTGHLIVPPGTSGRFAAASERQVAAKIEHTLERLDVGFGYGALGCGADMLFAEALLGRGAELHLVFPFELEPFKEVSVRPGGDGWEARFETCLAGAENVTFATRDDYMGDDMIFAYGSRIAMGLSRIRARNLEAPLSQVAVWDGAAATGPAGTAADVAYWRGHQLETVVIDSGPPAGEGKTASPPAARSPSHKRLIHPVVFTDLKGFSKFTEGDLLLFVDQVLARLARVVDKFGDRVLFRNTWGDAILLVFADVPTAARCSLNLQAELRAIPFAELGLPEDTGMRAALHVGPVFEIYDHLVQEKAYFGSTLTRAARIEPVTPVGEVYVTDAFAALTAFECADEVQCEYVGHMPTAKSYGALRMYVLKETGN